MNASKQAAWLFIALICLAASGWYFASSSKKFELLDDETLSTTADAIITNLTVQKFDLQGHLVNALNTPLLHHIPRHNQHWLKNPSIVVSQEAQAPWEIHSDQATSLNGGDQITFSQHVILEQKEKNSVKNTVLTEELTYFPNTKFATTDQEITLKQPGSIVHSLGMEAWLSEKRVKLLHQARGQYDPKRG